MGLDPLRGKPLALEPVDGPSLGDAARAGGSDASPDAKGHRDLRMTTSDKFLAQAAKEYQEGCVDQALWRRAADQCSNDASLMIATYLRTRATVLQLQQKADSRAQIQAPAAGSKRRAGERSVASKAHRESTSTPRGGSRLSRVNPKLMYAATAVTALAAMVAVIYLIVSPRGGDSVRAPAASAAASSPSPSATPTALTSERPDARTTNAGPAGPEPTLAATVRQLKSDGKWNVLVPYATEWTRQDPDNTEAWRELSIGYAKLRQFNDALDAGTKAVQLAPGDSLSWRNLGQLNLAVDRLPEAATAFDKALAISPDDVDALCGAVLVAHRQGTPKDAEAAARRVQSLTRTCPGVSDGESAPVPAVGTTPRKSASAAGR